MPSIRIGLTTNFNLVGEQVGIGTTNPTATLEVAGEIRANNIISPPSGITSFTEYTGFLQPVQLISNTVSIAETTKGNLNSLSDEIKISGEVTIEPDVSVTGGRLDSLTATDRFAVPLGETNNRDNAPEAGTTRFNQDFGTLEFFDGANWKTVNSYSRGGAAGRGFSAGGNNPAVVNTISYVTISTLGNAQDFGDLYDATTELSGTAASSTRGVIGGGRTPSHTDVISYITMASEGNSIDFGNLDRGRLADGLSNSTRGIFFNGFNPAAAPTGYGGNTNVIEYIEIATTGNAKDFGDSSQVKRAVGSGCASPTRGVFGGGFTSNPRISLIEYVTIASLGDAIEFGHLVTSGYSGPMFSNAVRGIKGGVNDYDGASHWTKNIEYLTIATTGSSEYFGDLTVARYGGSGSSSQTRGVFSMGAESPGTNTNIIDYVQIASTGNAVDFGDDLFTGRYSAGFSDSHGGLGGF